MAYSSYKGRCVGRLLHFLYDYTKQADGFCFAGNKVYADSKCKKLVATFIWDGNTDVPTFQFVGEFKSLETQQSQRKPQIVKVNEMMNNINIVCSNCQNYPQIKDELCKYCNGDKSWEEKKKKWLRNEY